MADISILSRLLRSGARRGAVEFDALKSGARFRHVTPRGTVEIARVINTAADGFGIRHVNFTLAFHYHDKNVDAGQRILSAVGFLKRYVPLDDERTAGRVEPSLNIPRPPEA